MCVELVFDQENYMDQSKLLEENLRQAACEGNEASVQHFINSGVNLNAQNAINGWTALHWAAKRGHISVVKLLCNAGASKEVTAKNLETPCDVASNDIIVNMLFSTSQMPKKDLSPAKPDAGFLPNYLAHPVFPYSSPVPPQPGDKHVVEHAPEEQCADANSYLYQPKSFVTVGSSQHCPTGLIVNPEELVLKVRLDLRNCPSGDFVEVPLNRRKLVSLKELTVILCQHIGESSYVNNVKNIRKLPNTILKNDDDVRRLTDYQELEIVFCQSH